MPEHLIFFDGECALCHRAVRHIIEIDEEKKIAFAPLKGETAKHILSGPNERYAHMNSLIFLENYQSTNREFWTRSQAILRVYWIIGGKWALIGWLSFFPCWIANFFYRWVANHRHQFKFRPMHEIGPKDRFLP